MDTAETSLDLTINLVGPPDNLVVVLHRAGDLDKLLAHDWLQYGENRDIRVVAEGYTDRNIQFWSEEEWPLHMRLTANDFADKRGRVFAHDFKGRIKPTRFTLPSLSQDMLDELGTISDYLLTFDADTREFGLRLRSLTEAQRPFWFMAKLAR